jgi:hypothetical protein
MINFSELVNKYKDEAIKMLQELVQINRAISDTQKLIIQLRLLKTE